MPLAPEARIGVILARPDRAGPEEALLAEGGHPDAVASFLPGKATGHGPGCPCCLPRNAAGRALALLLQARARGEVPFFRRVVAFTTTEEGRAELLAALATDPVASACFRLVSEARPHRPSRSDVA